MRFANLVEINTRLSTEESIDKQVEQTAMERGLGLGQRLSLSKEQIDDARGMAFWVHHEG